MNKNPREKADVAAKIVQLRQGRGWSQHRLGKETDFSRDYVAGVESGGTIPSPKFLRACEMTFNVRRGSLMKFRILRHAELFCRRNDVYIIEYIDLLREALQEKTLGDRG